MIDWPLTLVVCLSRPCQRQVPVQDRPSSVKGWAWVAAYTLLLYATLPFARDWQLFLKDRLDQNYSLAINLFLTGMGLVAIGWLLWRMGGLRPEHRPRGLRRLSLLAVALLALWLASRIDLPEERIHLLAYAVLGYLLARAVTLCVSGGLSGILILSTVPLAGWLIGFGDELIQGVLPERVFDWRDVWMNGVGCVLGLAILRLSRGGLP